MERIAIQEITDSGRSPNSVSNRRQKTKGISQEREEEQLHQ